MGFACSIFYIRNKCSDCLCLGGMKTIKAWSSKIIKTNKTPNPFILVLLMFYINSVFFNIEKID